MNVAVKTLNQTVVSPVVLSWPVSIRLQLSVWILIFSVLLSAFSLIYIRDVNRKLVNDLQMSQSTYQTLHIEWSRLLLEKSTLSVRPHIAKVAKQKLGMITPSADSIVLVKTV
jgi:cell division protein FtsL